MAIHLPLVEDGRLLAKLVKLDRSIVASLPDKRGNADVFLRIADKLGAEVIAEGIECEEELAAVRKLGIKYGQGYLLGMPEIPSSALAEGGGQ